MHHAGVAPTPASTAVFQEDGTCAWAPCTVIDYDAASNHYAIIMEPASNGGAAAAPAAAAAPVWVPRVALHFAAEDPFLFARRCVGDARQQPPNCARYAAHSHHQHQRCYLRIGSRG